MCTVSMQYVVYTAQSHLLTDHLIQKLSQNLIGWLYAISKLTFWETNLCLNVPRLLK